ncbi:MAG: hypothetical protein KAQ75_00945 [Bacteroidales bacterium]|nr:hypothetical protein [Bacteroidales bacterium]
MTVISKISEFISGAGTNLIDSLSDAVDEFVTTKEEKEKLKQELLRIQGEQQQNQRSFIVRMEELTQEREKEVEETIRMELDAKKEILMAELNQDDRFTKRARPTVVYVGLIFILLELLGLRHIIMTYLKVDAEIIANSDQIFKIFLGVWGSVLGVYSIGRSVEKRGTRNSWTSVITGNKPKIKPGDFIQENLIKTLKNKITWQ